MTSPSHPLPVRKTPSPIPQPAAHTARKTSRSVTAVHLPDLRQGRLTRLARRLPVRQILCLLPLLLVAIVAVQHRSVLVEGFGHLRTASPVSYTHL